MPEPKSYRFPQDLVDLIEDCVEPNGPYPSRTAFFVEAAREKLARLRVTETPAEDGGPDEETLRRLNIRLLPFSPAFPQEDAGGNLVSRRKLCLTIGPTGVSPTVRVLTDIDNTHVSFLHNLYATGPGVLPYTGVPAPLVLVDDLMMYGTPNLLPGRCAQLLSAYSELETRNAPRDVYPSSTENRPHGYEKTPGLQWNPICIAPNRTFCEVHAQGLPGQTTTFYLFLVVETLRDDSWNYPQKDGQGRVML